MGKLFNNPPPLEEGSIVFYDKRIWRVGLVNECRARLDPVTGMVTTADPMSGRSFQSYGSSVNISPMAQLVEAEVEGLDVDALRRLQRLIDRADVDEVDTANRRAKEHDREVRRTMIEEEARATKEELEAQQRLADEQAAEEQRVIQQGHGTRGRKVPVSVSANTDDGQSVKRPQSKGASNMAVATAVTANRVAGAAPVPPASKKEQVKAATAKAVVAKGADKPAREAKVKEQRACACGCGTLTGGYFVPGHDARFKGWMLKIERGEAKKEDLLTPAVIAQYKWVNVKGAGQRTTTNYKGESHQGYDTRPVQAVNGAAAE